MLEIRSRREKTIVIWKTLLVLGLTVLGTQIPEAGAAALLYDHGFETGDTSEFSHTVPGNGTGFVGNEAGIVRQGRFAGRMNLALLIQRAYVEQTLALAQPDLYVKCAFRLGPDLEVLILGEILSLIETDPRKPAAAVALKPDRSLSLVTFDRAGKPVSLPVAQTQGPLEPDKWFEIELHYRSDLAPDGPLFELYLDGVRILSHTPASPQSLIRSVCYGQRAEWLEGTLATGAVYFDLCKGSAEGLIGQEADKVAAVLVDRSDAAGNAYRDYASERVKDLLNHLGLPFLEIDVDSVLVAPELLGPFDLLVLGQERLGDSLSAGEETAIAETVRGGVGLVSFDPYIDRYESEAFQEMLGNVGWTGTKEARSLAVPENNHFITAEQSPEAADRSYAWSGGVPQLVLFDTGRNQVLATSDSGPALLAGTYGQGRVTVWLLANVLWDDQLDGPGLRYLGHLHGVDDLVWRGLVWACRKPMAWRPLAGRTVALKFDDCRGRTFGGEPFGYLERASEAFGVRAHASLFLDAIDDAEAQILASLVDDGKAEVSAHAFDGGDTDPNERSEWFIYWDAPNDRPFPAPLLAARWDEAVRFFTAHGLPFSPVLAPSFGVAGVGNLPYLEDNGIVYANMIHDLGTVQGTGGNLWKDSLPFRNGVQALDFLGHGEGPFNVSSWADFHFWSYDYLIRYKVLPYEAVDSPEEALENASRQIRWAHAARFPMILLTHEYVIEMAGFDLTAWSGFLSLLKAWAEQEGSVFLDLPEMARLARDHATSRILSYLKTSRAITLLLEGKTTGKTEVEFWFGDADPQSEAVPAFNPSRTLAVSWSGPEPPAPEEGGCGCSHLRRGQAGPAPLFWIGPFLPVLAVCVWLRLTRRRLRVSTGHSGSESS